MHSVQRYYSVFILSRCVNSIPSGSENLFLSIIKYAKEHDCSWFFNKKQQFCGVVYYSENDIVWLFYI